MSGTPIFSAARLNAELSQALRPGQTAWLVLYREVDSDPGGLAEQFLDERGFKAVATMPPWVRAAYDRLPFPTTRTDADGAYRWFELEGGIGGVVSALKHPPRRH